MGKVIQFPKAENGLEVLKWQGDSLNKLEIFDGDLLFYRTDISGFPFGRICIVEIKAIDERRIKLIEDWGNELVELSPMSQKFERIIFHISEIRIIGVVVEWF